MSAERLVPPPRPRVSIHRMDDGRERVTIAGPEDFVVLYLTRPALKELVEAGLEYWAKTAKSGGT